MGRWESRDRLSIILGQEEGEAGTGTMKIGRDVPDLMVFLATTTLRKLENKKAGKLGRSLSFFACFFAVFCWLGFRLFFCFFSVVFFYPSRCPQTKIRVDEGGDIICEPAGELSIVRRDSEIQRATVAATAYFPERILFLFGPFLFFFFLWFFLCLM